MTGSNNIRVIVVDDHDMVRRGLSVFLDTFEDLDLVGEAASGEEALEVCEEIQPDVVLMDIMMPGIGGLEAIRLIHNAFPDIQLVALTSSKDETLVRSALEAGAIGFLLKNATVDDLANAIRTANAGKPALSVEATQALIHAASRPAPLSYNLTDREIEVLGLMAEGQTNRQIALTLSLSLSTIKFYVSSILSKFDVASRTEAVALALQNDLIE